MADKIIPRNKESEDLLDLLIKASSLFRIFKLRNEVHIERYDDDETYKSIYDRIRKRLSKDNMFKEVDNRKLWNLIKKNYVWIEVLNTWESPSDKKVSDSWTKEAIANDSWS